MMGRPIATDLTTRQKEVLETVGRIGQGGRVLVSDLVSAVGMTRPESIFPTLERIERAGYLEITGGGRQRRARLLDLTARARTFLGLSPGVPLLGIVAAGTPGGCTLEEQEWIQCSVHPNGEKYSYTIISGDSVDKEGVLDGDRALIERIDSPRENQIVVAQITRGGSCEFTLKYFHRNPETGTIALVPHSHNREHRALLLASECSAADWHWLRRVAKPHRPVTTKRDVECIAVEAVEINWCWNGGLIRLAQKTSRTRRI
jgi:repressor LexA